MTKIKVAEEARLKYSLIIRVNEALYQKLNKVLQESDRQNMAEVIRDILENRKIRCFYKDARLDGPMEEMALIRKELKAIGININQQTRYFNACKRELEKNFHAGQTLVHYQQIGQKVDRLIELISKLAETWLQRS